MTLRRNASLPRGLPLLLGLLLVAPLVARPAAARWSAGLGPSTDRAETPAAAGFDTFRARLEALEQGERRVVRVVHLGDSEVSDDLVVRTLRHRFAERYGDAGPGFVAAMRPWSWYYREAWRAGPPDGFRPVVYSRAKLPGGGYGPGGVAFEAKRAGALAEVALARPILGPCDVAFHFARQPAGAALELLADGVRFAAIRSASVQSGPTAERRRFVDCPRRLAVRVGEGPATIYGWSVEGAGSGVVWSSLGVVAGRLPLLLRYEDAALRDGLRALRPDLVVLSFGINAAAWPRGPSSSYFGDVEVALGKVRDALPGAPCLVVGPYPLGRRRDGHEEAHPVARWVSQRMGRAAVASGCGYLDRYEMVGGAPAVLRWRQREPPRLRDDLVHLTANGSDWMGERIFRTLVAGLALEPGRRFPAHLSLPADLGGG